MIYLASPYSHPMAAIRQRRYDQVTAYAGRLMREGWLVYCPISYGHQFADIGTDAATWMAHNDYMLQSCDSMWIYMLPGWQESRGLDYEIRFAKQLGLPRVYKEPLDG